VLSPRGMRATLVARALSRAVLVALAAPALIVCGGKAATSAPGPTSESNDGDGGLASRDATAGTDATSGSSDSSSATASIPPTETGTEESGSSDTVETDGGCAPLPGATVVDNCLEQCFELVGPACNQIAPGPPVGQCEELCPR